MNHILIAEDEHLIARLVEMTLTRAGYRCAAPGAAGGSCAPLTYGWTPRTAPHGAVRSRWICGGGSLICWSC